jgi:hypothetical protein
MVMRVDKTVRAEQRKVHAMITRKDITWDTWAEGFLKGAQQALAWARGDNAVAPTTCVTEAMAKAEQAVVDDAIAENIVTGNMEVAGVKNGEPTYRITDTGIAETERQMRDAGYDPDDKESTRRFMREVVGLDVDALDAMLRAKREAGL